MPWHKLYNPKIDYQKHSVNIESMSIPILKNTEPSETSIQNLSTKHDRYLEICGIYNLKLSQKYPKDSCELKDERSRKQLVKYARVFRKDLPAGLPPIRDVYN